MVLAGSLETAGV